MFKERLKTVFKVKRTITMESMKQLMQKDESGDSAKTKFYPHKERGRSYLARRNYDMHSTINHSYIETNTNIFDNMLYN